MGCGGSKEEKKDDKKPANKAASPKNNETTGSPKNKDAAAASPKNKEDAKKKEAAAASPKNKEAVAKDTKEAEDAKGVTPKESAAAPAPANEPQEAEKAAAAAAPAAAEKEEAAPVSAPAAQEAQEAPAEPATAPSEPFHDPPQETEAEAAPQEPEPEEEQEQQQEQVTVPPLDLNGATKENPQSRRKSLQVDHKTVEFAGPGPSSDFPFQEIYQCFDEGNGLLFRLVNVPRHSWAFYNDSEEYIMRIAITFGQESAVKPLGEAQMTMHEEETGRCTIEVDVAPGQTQLFMRGDYNGMVSSYDADPIPYEERKKAAEAAANTSQ